MTPAHLKGQRVTVIGGQRSGVAVARLLRQTRAKVLLTEKAEAQQGLPEQLEALGIGYEFGGHTRAALDADFLVISPGVPSTVPLVQQALRSGLNVYSEIEVSSWFCKAPIVAITGSNGKTTTTSLTGHIFRQSGRQTVVAGNIGYPFADYVADLDEKAVVVLEVSSFQLDHIDTFRPKVAILLNITPDHLDRYNYDFNAYAQSKFRIFENQREDDVLIYNHDDRFVAEYIDFIKQKRTLRTMGFSQRDLLETGAFLRDEMLVLRIHQHEEPLMHANHFAPALAGPHNCYNSMAAAVAARILEVRSDVIRESLASFEGVPHRLEFVREVDGVRYVNDSKATNVNAVWYALETFTQPIILIAGGRDKGNDYNSLKPLVRKKVQAVIGLGESADKVLHELGPYAQDHLHADTLEEALHCARLMAKPGQVVLLSPACASFDMFANYEDRGDTFKRLVAAL